MWIVEIWGRSVSLAGRIWIEGCGSGIFGGLVLICCGGRLCCEG